MKFALKHAAWLSIILASISGSAQVSTGTPALGSFGGGPFDTVNLGNLNVHFSVPILHKAGRGVPFSYDLSYDGSIWQQGTVNGTVQWVPSGTWGWTAQSLAQVGYISIAETSSKPLPGKFCPNGQFGTKTTNTDTYTYVDWIGKTHPFPGSTYWIEIGGACNITQYGPQLVTTATDGSGFVLTANANETGDTVKTRSGALVNTNVGFNGGNGAYFDSNGNELTYNNSTRQFFDTLSGTSPVLTLGGSGTPSSPITYTYVAPSGANATYTVNYAAYTVATNFGFTGTPLIHEFGPASENLVSSIQLADGSEYQFTYETTPGSCTPLSGTYSANCVTARMALVTLPTGGTITYGYTGGSNGILSDGSTAGLTRTLSPGGEWQYSRTLQSGTPGSGSTWSTTAIDPNSNYTVINFAEDGTTTVPTYNLYETQRQVYQGSISPGNLLATVIRCYNAHYSGCATAVVTSPIAQTDTYSQLPNGNTRLSETTFNSYGLVTDDREYDYGVAVGSAPGTTHLVRETGTTYASLTNGIVDRPATVIVSDWSSGSASTISSVSYTYDQGTVTSTSGTPQLAPVSGSRGNLTTIATQANSGTTLYQTFSYYNTGNWNQSTGSSTSATTPGPATTYNYASGSCGNSFVTSISEPLGLGRSTGWNCTGGVATQTTDENSQTASTNYTDPYFWRPANVYDQQNNETTISYVSPTTVESNLTFNVGKSVVDLRGTVDGFGRPILSQTLQGPGASSYDTGQTDFNAIGLPSRSTLPFSAAAGGTSSSAPGLATTYDALGRPLTVTDAGGGATSYTYTNNDVLVTVSGSQTFKKQLEYDGLGRLTSVCEMSTSLTGVGACGQSTAQTGYWTKYAYSALGLTVTQNAQSGSNQQTRSYSSDWLGRLTSESNPETGNSGTNGTVTYTYDVACTTTAASPGDLTTKVDNAGNKTCFGYDALHRVTDAGYIGVCRRYRYDTSVTPPGGVTVANTKTRIIEAKTDNCSGTQITDEWFSYSSRGELTDVYESTPHSGGYYHTSAAYWPSGALETLSGIPSVPTLYYGASNNGGAGLDGEGRYTQVTAASGTNPMTHVSYSTSSTTSILGAIVGITFGSGDGDTFGFDQNTGRQTSYKAYLNGTITDGGILTYNRNGTPATLAITDNISGTNDSQSCSFTYDDLGRLGGRNANGYSVDCGTKWQQLFTYDAFGNIVKSGSSSFAATYSLLPPTNQFGLAGTNVQYDANGNLLTDNLNTYTWDPNWGTMASVNGITATYDALGRVVEQQNGSSYAEILYSPVGKTAIMNGTTLAKAFVGLPGGGTAVYTSSGLSYYRHADWLGSSRLSSTQSRGLYSSTAYAPFGELYTTANGTVGAADPSFTGQNSDTTSSLYDFTFRRQSPSQGRWISPDPAGLAAVNPANPQTWNRYAYVANEPLNSVDPTGLLLEGPPGSPGGGASPLGGQGDYNNQFDPTGSGSIWGGAISGVSTYSWVPYAHPTLIGYDQYGTPIYSTTTGYWQLTGGFYEASGPLYSIPPGVNLGGMGSPSAPNNATPWYKNPCIQSALAKGAASTALDAVGLLPEGGAVSAAFSLWHGAAGVSNGTKILERVQFGAALIGTANAGSDVSGSEGAFSLSGAQALTGAATIGAGLLKAAPVVGQVLSGISVAGDLYGTYKAVAGCHP